MFENIRLSFRGIWAHKMRSFLTMLGIIIGIAAIIAIVSTIKGTNEQIKQNLVGAGENTVEISLYQGEWEYEMEYNGIPEGVPLVADEVVEQLKEIPHVENVSRYLSRQDYNGVYHLNTGLSGGYVKGVDTAYFDTCNYIMKEGRGFTQQDFDQYHKVAILDADITGPSIPKMFGIHGQVYGTDDGMVPMETENGIKIMSINLLLDDEEAPVIWRGPVIAGVVKQFWNETVWGDVDYLFVDMPPGTGDVPLTVFQSLPVDGIVIVTSPQELVQMIVKKAYNMAEMMHVPVLGLVENFSYLKCPDCGKEIKLFGESHIDDVAKELGIPVFGKLPLDPAFAEQADKGAFATMENAYLDAGVEKLKTL